MDIDYLGGIFLAEDYALLQACKLANGVQTVVFSDSANCLSAIEHGWIGHPGLIEVQRFTNITFIGVPGHMGITGNETADKLANQGRYAQQEIPTVPYCDPTRWVKQICQFEAYVAPIGLTTKRPSCAEGRVARQS